MGWETSPKKVGSLIMAKAFEPYGSQPSTPRQRAPDGEATGPSEALDNLQDGTWKAPQTEDEAIVRS